MRNHLIAIALLALAVRLAHSRVLWIEEAYPMAAAIQILHGRLPYADFWYDKPPLTPLLYLLWGAAPGWAPRLAGALYVTACAALAGRLGGVWSAWLLAFSLSFGLPSAVIALAPDLLLIAPHLAVVSLAQAGRPLLAGLTAGLALLIHAKALFLLPIALLWAPHWRLLAGFAAAALPQALLGPDYWQQVWVWGRLYSTHTFVDHPLAEFARRTANWAGFHLATLTPLLTRRLPWRHAAWLALSLASVLLGLRFFPRYYFFLLVPCAVLAGPCLEALRPVWRYSLLALVLIPVLRFGPRHLTVASGNLSWEDLALFRDSQTVAAYLREQSKPSDTLFVWGYRPDIDSLSRLPGGTPFLESQPLNCVLADRHLRSTQPLPDPACPARLRRFRESEPTWLVDGLGPLNPRLRLEAYRSLRGYELVLRTPSALLYRLAVPQNQPIEARSINPRPPHGPGEYDAPPHTHSSSWPASAGIPATPPTPLPRYSS